MKSTFDFARLGVLALASIFSLTTGREAMHRMLSGGVLTMKWIFQTGAIALACLAFTVAAQDWYHDREQRFRDEHWRSHVFEQVRSDLDHIGSARRAAERERRRLEKTKQELTDLQAKLDQGRYDEGELNDVIDSLAKSANDERLSPRDRDVLHDDTNRLREYREHHEHWAR
jgi:hypothetical protein